MPPQQGEVSLLTLFADVHYYFSPPAQKPVHHRFDKASYVYLYHDAINKRGRLEIANHAGTPDQDAFNGSLDRCQVQYSYKHPTLFTITVEGQGSPSSPSASDMSQWHLPGFDLRSEAKYMYKLQVLDVYFWTTADAQMFLDSLRRCIQPQQINVLDVDAAPTDHRNSMSPVVQKLEQAATASHTGGAGTVPSPQNARPNQTPVTVSPIATPPATESRTDYAPMAYNPAAPAAPEPIAPREKTPPPHDAAGGTGLNQASVHELGATSYSPQATTNQHAGYSQSQQQGSMPPPPPPPAQGLQRTDTASSLPPPPPPQQGTPYTAGFAPPPQDPNAHHYGQQQASQYQQQHQYQQQTQQPLSPPPHQQSYSGAQPQQQPSYQGAPPAGAGSYGYQNQQPGTPSYQGHQHPASTPGYQSTTPGYGQQPGGLYSSNSYTGSQYGGNVPPAQSIHQQVYAPEGQGQAQATQGAPAQQHHTPGRADASIAKIEKGVGRLLKKFDKKF